MTTATATLTTTTTTALLATTSSIHNDSLSSSPDLLQQWACDSCHATFGPEQTQKSHLKDPWQYVWIRLSKLRWAFWSLTIVISIYNLKRQIASLQPVSLDVFNDQVAQIREDVANATEDRSTTEVAARSQNPSVGCLFCAHQLDCSGNSNVQDLLEHMSAVHGLFIPDQTMISDLEVFIGYLSTVVHQWHECLYCGVSRVSTEAVQSHMRDSGHCMLNLEREPELLDFWEERSDSEQSALSIWKEQKSSIPSRKSAAAPSSHGRARPSRATEAQLALALAATDPSQSPPLPPPPRQRSGLQLARRDEMGITNITPQQRHALVLAVKRSQKDEALATRAREWGNEKRNNKQKHDQNHGPLSWAKAGLHNLLPR